MLGGGGGGGATGLLNKGGSNRLPGLVTKQQAVEFPQVLASYIYFLVLQTQICELDRTNCEFKRARDEAINECAAAHVEVCVELNTLIFVGGDTQLAIKDHLCLHYKLWVLKLANLMRRFKIVNISNCN